MFRTIVALMALVSALHSAAGFAAGKCEVARVAELPVTMMGTRPTVLAKINGKDARFVLDSGAFYSSISSATAAEYGLKTYSPNRAFHLVGVGGWQEAKLTMIKEFTLVGVPIKDLEFIVGGNEVGTGTVGLLGENFLRIFDVEYDLGHGVVRLFQTKNCEHVRLAYWLTDGQAFSEMKIEATSAVQTKTLGFGFINGQKINMMFDTGASTTVLTTAAAARAGIKVDSPGVQPAGYSTGIGRGTAKNYIARFDSFKIGDGEEIKNARLRIADINLGLSDMLLGADFFISHRVFVANKETMLWTSYAGGPVFDLSKKADAPLTADAILQGIQDVPAKEDASEGPASAELMTGDPSEAAREGAALVARRDFAGGIRLLTKAIALSPSEPEYYYERGNGYWASGQKDLAQADFEQAIKLQASFLAAYLPHAELQLQKSNAAGALIDLEQLDHLAPKQENLRFLMAAMYDRTDHPAEAISQYGLWIDSHPDDSRMGEALSARCYMRALQNQDLSAAMRDCDRGLSHVDKASQAYVQRTLHRAVLYIRMGNYNKALEDCEEALKHSAKDARGLYLRAIAEAHSNKKGAKRGRRGGGKAHQSENWRKIGALRDHGIGK